MRKAWSGTEEMPYCFSRSSVKFQGHIALKIVEFNPNWAFPDCNSRLNWPMAMKCWTKLETAKKRCPIVFQGHPSNFKVTRDKTSPILTQIGRFRTIGRSQLSNPSDLPCFKFVVQMSSGVPSINLWLIQSYLIQYAHSDLISDFSIFSIHSVIFSCDQAAIWLVQSVCLSVCLSVRLSVCLSVCPSVCHTFLTMFPSSYHHEIFKSNYHSQKWCPCKRSRSEVKGQGHRGQHPT